MGEWEHQELAIVGTVDPTAITAAATAWTDAIDMKVFERAIFILMVNTIAANTTVTLSVYADNATATGGMTTLVKAADGLTNADDDKQVMIVVDTEDIDPDSRHRYVRGKLVVAGAGGTSTHAVVALGGGCRYHPASAYDLASVDQVINS